MSSGATARLVGVRRDPTAVLVLLRTVLESIRDSGAFIVDYKLASESMNLVPQGSQLPSQVS